MLIQCVLLVVFFLTACQEEEPEEVELSWENIGEYLAIDIAYANGGPSFGGGMILQEIINIYPIRGGSFNNVELLLCPDYELEGWDLINPNDSYTQSGDENSYYRESLARIKLPSSGEYQCVHEFRGVSVYSIPLPYTDGWSEKDTTIDENWIKKYGDFVEVGEPIISGTFKEY